MLEAIEKLLVLQDRDRRILRLKQELAMIPVEREQLTGKASQSQGALDAARQRVLQCETERKRRELEIESKREQIERYSTQQFQTRKNEEFRALGHEIETAKKAIFEIENQILEIMEQAEAAQKEVTTATAAAKADKAVADSQVAVLNDREANLKKDLAGLEAERAGLAGGVEPGILNRYERLLKSKGDNVVVSIERGVCGGCHMQISRQIVVDCRAQQNLVTCLNCGRILFFTPDMDVDVVE